MPNGDQRGNNRVLTHPENDDTDERGLYFQSIRTNDGNSSQKVIHFDALNDVYPGNLIQKSPAATVIVNKYNMGPSSLDKESKSSFSRKQHIPQTDQHR